jgi:peptide/nickel transport system substrate-binding protein
MMRQLSRLLFVTCIASLAWACSAYAAGTLRVAIPSNLNTLDPAKTKLGEEYILNFLLFSGLTEIDSAGKVSPDLATSWSASADQRTWKFNLRKGVKFHDGSEVTADDVKATFDRILDPATGSVARAVCDIVEKVDVLDPHTVEFKLKIPYSGFPEVVSDRQARIVPKAKLATLAKEPVGSGPFMFKSWLPGDRVEIVRNPNYYDKNVPKLDAVTLKIIPESASSIAALETAEVDLIWNVPLEAIAELKKKKGIVVDSVPTQSWDGVIMNLKQKPFDDKRVRLAVEAALDKNAIVEAALFGHGKASHTMISPASQYYNASIPIPPADIQKAKALLAEAGYPNGFDITLYVSSGRPARDRIAVVAREMLRAAGIRVNIERIPFDKFITDIEGKAPFYIDGFLGRATVDNAIYPWFHSRGSWNSQLWHYSNPEVDRVLDGARSAQTEAEQAKLYKEFQRLAIEDPPGVIVYVIDHVNAYRANVKHFKSHPLTRLDFRQTTIE